MVLLLLSGCAPRLRPLVGEIAPATVPTTQILSGRNQILFEWEFADPDMSGKGDGAVRMASPDSLRLDFFIAGGFGSGGAVLIGDTLSIPGIELTRRLIPPPTLLWAALGRTHLPATPDTVTRREGNLLRADVGRPVQWRITFRGDTLIRLEHVEGGRIVEWVDRTDTDRVEYHQETAHRSLKLHLTGVFAVKEFDAAIWHIDR
jgi:hypothetical protein